MYRTLATIGINSPWSDLIVNPSSGDIYISVDTLANITGIKYWNVHTITYPAESIKVTVRTTHGISRKSLYTEQYMCDFLKKFKPDVYQDYLHFLSDFCQYPITYL